MVAMSVAVEVGAQWDERWVSDVTELIDGITGPPAEKARTSGRGETGRI
jgi:hypothetical protein